MGDLKLWYRQPLRSWGEALPIGNTGIKNKDSQEAQEAIREHLTGIERDLSIVGLSYGFNNAEDTQKDKQGG